ncbi:nitroreductase family protein [Pacificoceanicola onchidii]|uniref:nitroreductase family protein n=1 Tax=Pacificoceanicola onchidii TaxID=2562685 RepID=UPI0010A4F319|nr:nitroreductase [Pacificoceanicola onchidii]
MPDSEQDAFDFLLRRRSRPAKTLTGPGPDRAALMPMLTAAARTPDHGKLEPWRFIVLEEAALRRMTSIIRSTGERLGKDAADIEKATHVYTTSPLCVAVIEVQKDSPKIPAIEQTYSAGAVCLALLNAALASGWGANWLSGWFSHDRAFMSEALGLAAHERIAGLIHIGTETSTPPERPRPDLEAITSWVSE